MKGKRIIARLVLILLIAELLLVFLSWLLSATLTESVRPLLSSEGIRWFLGQFSVMLLKPQLIWLILLAMAAGCVWRSGIFRPSQLSFRRHSALRVSFIVLVILIIIVALLVMMPQAVLLSSTGLMWPSPFSRALVPILSALAIITSMCYGLLSRTFASLYDVYESFCIGLRQAVPLLILYLFVVMFYESCLYVFF
jgi:aminobenzoyl-glutamate transport protein